MSTQQEQAGGGWDDFDGEVDAAKSKAEGGSPIPDATHVFQIQGMRRKRTAAEDMTVSIDLSTVASKINNAISREFQGVQIEDFFWLPKNDPKIRAMNLERLMGNLAIIMGKAPEGKFSTHFDQWVKEITGLCYVAAQKTSDKKDAKGKPYINYHIDKAYTLTDADRAALGASATQPGADVPF